MGLRKQLAAILLVNVAGYSPDGERRGRNRNTIDSARRTRLEIESHRGTCHRDGGRLL